MQPTTPAVQAELSLMEFSQPLDGVGLLGAVVTIEGASVEAYILAAMGKALGPFAYCSSSGQVGHDVLQKEGLASAPKVGGRHGHPYKATLEVRVFIFETKRDIPFLSAREIVRLVQIKFTIELSISHINYLLRKEKLSNKVGRRKKTQTPSNLPVPTV